MSTERGWIVLSWRPEAPRDTFRLDGHYFSKSYAVEIAAFEEKEQGRVALILENVGKAMPIPDELVVCTNCMHDVEPDTPLNSDS